MKTISLIEKIHDNYGKLSHTQRKAADYLLEHQDFIAFHTLDELAMQIGVSTTTIIRMARILGYKGYTDIQKNIQKGIRERESLPVRLSEIPYTIDDNILFQNSFENDIRNIKTTMEQINKEDVKKAVEMLIGANKIYVFGLREAFALSYTTRVVLGQIKENVTMITGLGNTYPEEAVGIKEDDLCILFTFPRYSEIMFNLLQWMKEQKSKIIIITSQIHYGLEGYANLILPCYTEGVSFKYSMIAPMCLVNYLVAAVANHDREVAKKQSEKIERLNKTALKSKK